MPYVSKTRKKVDGGCAIVLIILIMLSAGSKCIKGAIEYAKSSNEDTKEITVDSIKPPTYTPEPVFKEHDWHILDTLPIPKYLGDMGDSCYVSSVHWFYVKEDNDKWVYKGEMYAPPKLDF